MHGFKPLDDLDLHDSVLVSINHLLSEGKVSLVLELCNWRQNWYQPEDPQVVKQEIVFDGVYSFCHTSTGGGELTHDEIRTFNITVIHEAPRLYKVELVLGKTEAGADEAIIEIIASDVISHPWLPLPDPLE